MTPSERKVIGMFLASLEHACWNKEAAVIGKGEYSPAELIVVAAALRRALKPIRKAAIVKKGKR